MTAALPPACSLCASQGGFWCSSPQGGAHRCRCARGAILAAADARRTVRKPVAQRPRASVIDWKLRACGPDER